MVHCEGKLHLFILEYLIGFDEVVQVLHQDVCTLLAALKQFFVIQHEVIEEADIVEGQTEAGTGKVFVRCVWLCRKNLAKIIKSWHVDELFIESEDLIILLLEQGVERLQKLVFKRLLIQRKYLVETYSHQLDVAEGILLYIISFREAMHNHVLEGHLRQPLLEQVLLNGYICLFIAVGFHLLLIVYGLCEVADLERNGKNTLADLVNYRID